MNNNDIGLIMHRRLNIKYIGRNRNDWIAQHCKDKHVIHIGCTDSMMTQNHLQNGLFLHEILTKNSYSVIGLDIDRTGIQFMKNSLNYDNVMFGDAERLSKYIHKRFDVIVACDVIEHFNNPGLFFSEAKKCLLQNEGGIIILSFPNSLSIKNIVSAIIRRKETNHPNHVSCYSPMCIEEICRRWNYKVNGWVGYTWSKKTIENKIGNFVPEIVIKITKNGYLAQGIGCILSMNIKNYVNYKKKRIL